MSTNGVFIIAVVVTICLTFYIVAGAKNTNSAGEAEANFTLLWSIGFLTAALGSGFVGSKAPASPLKELISIRFTCSPTTRLRHRYQFSLEPIVRC